MNAVFATTLKDVDLQWTTWVDYDAPPRYRDTLLTYDDFVYAVTYERPVDEMIFTSDEVSLYTGFTRAPADTATLADIFTFAATYIRAFADPMVVTDDITLILGTTATVNYADAVAMTEVFGTALTMPRSLADSMVTSDVFSSTSTVVLNFADSVAMGDGQAFDPMWDKVMMLLHFDGGNAINGGNNLGWIDSSPYNKTVLTSLQLPFQGTVSPFVQSNTFFDSYPGGGSAFFGVVGQDSMYSPQSDHFHFPPGTDFTIECWVYITDNSPPDYNGDRTACILSTYPTDVHHGGWTINLQGVGGAGITGSNAVYLEKVGPGGSTYDAVVAGGISQRKWHHIAICRVGTLTRIFLDGVLGVTQTMNDQDVLANGPLVLGRDAAPGINRYFKGYIADVRISKGAAYYVSNFTPPTAKTDGSSLATAIKLEFSNAAIFDSARKGNAHLDGSYPAGIGVGGTPAMFFDGNNRNIQFPFTLGQRYYPMGEDFTAEVFFWLNGDSAPDNSGNRIASLVALYPTATPLAGWQILLAGDANTTGTFVQGSFIYADGTGDFINGFTGTIAKGGWHHIALSRVGMTGYLHYDGQMVASLPMTRSVIAPSSALGTIMLGMTAFTGYYRPFNGYLDEFRYTVGKARYGAANFVVQNAPFPNGVAAYTDTYNMQFADSVAMSEASVIVAPSTLILATSYLPGPSGVQAVTFPGCSAGQLAVLIASRSNVGAPPSGWNTVSNFSMVTTGYPQQVFTKILTAADIASGVTWNYSAGNGLFALLVYAGPTVCTQVSRAQGGSGALVVPGITKNAASRQLIAYSVCSQNNQNQLPSAPWTVRVPQVISPTVNTVVADLPSGSYGNGSAVTWLPNSNTMLGEILELT